jgi:hypothetical protein
MLVFVFGLQGHGKVETRYDDVSHNRLQKNADGLRPPLEFITSLDV